LKQNINVFWFKRDLRLIDNIALSDAIESKYPLLLIYLFEPIVINDQHISKKHIASKPENELHKSLLKYIKIYKNLKLSESCSNDLRRFLPLVVGRCSSLGEIFEACSFLFEVDEFENKETTLLEHENKKILYDFTNAITSTNLTWDHESLNEFINSYCQENNFKFRDIGLPLRIVITGSASSPSIAHIMEILGKKKTLHRLNINVDSIKN